MPASMGRRLAGLEELLLYLEAIGAAYRNHDELRKLAFLVSRAVADFETALEATLSGYQGVAADSMRDVMEIEYLVLDFATTPGNASEWLTCSRRVRLGKFAPAKIRARLIVAGLPPFGDPEWEAIDYRAHSESLHVTPRALPIAVRGIEPEPGSLLADAGFIEIFEHGWRLIRALELLRMAHVGETEMEPLRPLAKFFDTHQRTGEMLVIMIAMFEAPAVLRKKLGRDPTPSDVLKHVRDALLTESTSRPDDLE